MITLLEIANRLGKDSGLSFKEREYSWRPITTDEYTVPDFCIEESTAKGAKTRLRTKLSKVLAFVNGIRPIRAKSACTIITIPVKNKSNLMIWGSDKNVSNAIDFMEEIGLISVENESFRFYAVNEHENVAKTYRYYFENEKKLLQYCSDHGIEAFKAENRIYSIEPGRVLHKDIPPDKVRFSPNLRLVKPSDLSKTEFEKELTLCLYANYPGLWFSIMKANEINDTYYRDYPEFRIRFQPNFTWNSKNTMVTKIGIRATNSMTNIKKEDREAILKQYGFTLKKDINASVPRMTLSFNSGRWIDESEDLYERIFNIMEPGGVFTNEAREAIKKLHMRAYFDTSNKQVGHHTWLDMDKDGIDQNDVRATMNALRNAMVEAEGGALFGSEIFYIESCVYLMTLYDLLASGHRVWQVYDCFYSTGEETQEEFEELISNGVRLNFNDFYRTWFAGKPVEDTQPQQQKGKRGRPRKNNTDTSL